MTTFKTAESVCEGHPDKLCDYIADSVLDACLAMDKFSRVACEAMATKGHIIVAGEITCRGNVNIRKVVSKALRERGYDPRTFNIDIYVHRQSKDISNGVDDSLEARDGNERYNCAIGAGDQGTVYGYATNETAEYLPLPLVLAHRICESIDEARKLGKITGIKSDGKAQVTVEYENEIPKRVKSVVVSVQHEKEKSPFSLFYEIKHIVLLNVFRDFPLDRDTEILINPSGKFIEGGPSADTGLTGRKIMVDTYGGLAAHGGGAFSGKDPTKVDRSGAYMARHIAKNIVASGLAEKCEVAVSYAIGKAEPLAVSVKTFGTSEFPDEYVCDIIRRVFDMTPGWIIRYFGLRTRRYAPTSLYGHFSCPLYPWEVLNKVGEISEIVANDLKEDIGGITIE